MARTKAYDRQIYNAVKNINARLLDIERKLGIDSEQYRRYVNAITAAAPSGTYNMNVDTGRIRMKTGKAAREQLKLGQIRATQKLPTAKQSINQTKRQLAQMKQERGEEADAVSISDQEALEEMAAKQKIQEYEDGNGKLKYLEEAKEELSQKGKKSYKELADIMERAAKKKDKKEKRKAYYEANKERINERRRARRREQREARRAGKA